MRIGVIGAGNVGGALAPALAAVGHDVVVAGSRDPARLHRLAESGPGLKVGTVDEAAEHGELVVLAVPFGVVADVLTSRVRQALHGRVVVDVSNPVTPDYLALTVGFSTSAAEQIAHLLPGARVVKGFNTVFAQTMGSGSVGGRALTLFVASDDQEAGKRVLDLGVELGYEAVDAGPLLNARYLEPMGELLIQLGYRQGLGTDLGFALQAGGRG